MSSRLQQTSTRLLNSIMSTIAYPLLRATKDECCNLSDRCNQMIDYFRIQPDLLEELPNDLPMMKKTELQQLWQRCHLNQTGNTAELLTRLQEYSPTSLSPEQKEAVLKKQLLSQWYLQPKQGSGVSNAFKIGHQDEENISRFVPDFLFDTKLMTMNTDTPFPL